MPVNERFILLRAAGVAPGLSDEKLRALATAVDVCEIAAGEVLIPEDGPSRQSFVIVEGIADIHSSDVTVATVGPGSFFNALKADDRPFGATAQTDMTVLVLAPSVAQRFGLGFTVVTDTAKAGPRQESFGAETFDGVDECQRGER